MLTHRFRKWIGLWWSATFYGVTSALFGWASAAAAIPIGYLQQKFNLVEAVQEGPIWVLPAASFGAALIAALLVHAIAIAPYRAFRMLQPFDIKIVSGLIKREGPAGQFEPQRAAILVKNKSYLPRSNCVVHVQTVRDFNNEHHTFPRFIEKFSLQPGETQQIAILAWTARPAPSENDKIITFCGPVAWGWGGNFASLPCGSHEIEIRIGIADGDAISVFCSVWIEGDDLRAVKA